MALCGNTLTTGSIQVEKMTGAIVIGRTRPPMGCALNRLETGNIQVSESTIVQHPNTTGLDLQGNILGSSGLAGNRQGGDPQVFKNAGTAPKFVQMAAALICAARAQPLLTVGTNHAAASGAAHLRRRRRYGGRWCLHRCPWQSATCARQSSTRPTLGIRLHVKAAAIRLRAISPSDAKRVF